MASGFRFNGVDLDSVFARRYSGWPQTAATEFEIAGYGDIAQRYAVLSAGNAAPPTNFRLSSGADLNTVFAANGTTNVRVLTQPSAISGTAAAGSPSGTVTSNTTACAGTGGSGSFTYTWHIANGSGFSLTTPNSQTCGITGNVPAGQSVSGGIYCTIFDGVTSINTNTEPCSLTNTTPPTWNFSITAGTFSAYVVGYHPTSGTGSITGGTFGALTIADLHDVTNLGNSFLYISGFSSDPGKNSLTSIVSNGVTKLGSNATYTYSGGLAQWEWPGPGNVFGFVNGVNYPTVVTGSFT